MKCCCVEVYLAGGKQGVRAGMALEAAIERPELLKNGYVWVWPLTGKIGLYRAYRLTQELRTWPWKEWLPEGGTVCTAKGEPRWQERSWQKHVVKGVKWLLHRAAWPDELLLPGCPEALEEYRSLIRGLDSTAYQSRLVAALLRGRNLFLSEIGGGLREMGVAEPAPEEVVNVLIPLLLTDKVEMVPGVMSEEGYCERCGHMGLQQSQCGICGELTWYCPECREMGESTSCRPIFRRTDRGRLLAFDSVIEPQYRFPLSRYQEELSRRLQTALVGSRQQEWLLWAVCGAGKTETAFGLIGSVLGRGGRVLFTSPRREVVRQMVDRLGQAFPEITRVALFGGSDEKLSQAQLTIATVHQLVRFYRAFDLIIFDEVDAYPYKGDARLQRLLARSRKADGMLIYLSATPDADLLARAERGELEVLTLPARFHRKGVPVPELQAMPLPGIAEAEKMPPEVLRWIREAVFKDLAQVYIFLPGRQMVEVFGRSLKNMYCTEDLADWVEYTHSQDTGRADKVERFLRGDYPLLVTTTIMERGVTVPKGNVLVLYADVDEIFNSQSLVQMAGRAGRSLEAPHGSVLFVGRKITKAMQTANEWVRRMNAEAQERGLLDAENDLQDS